MDHLAPPLAARARHVGGDDRGDAGCWRGRESLVVGPPRPVRPAAAPGGAGPRRRPRSTTPRAAASSWASAGARCPTSSTPSASARPRRASGWRAWASRSTSSGRCGPASRSTTTAGSSGCATPSSGRRRRGRIPIVVGGVGPRTLELVARATPTGGTCRSTRSTGSTSCRDRVGRRPGLGADHGGARPDRGRPGRGHRARRPPLRRLGDGRRRRRRHGRRAGRPLRAPCGPGASSASTSGSPTSPRPRRSPASARSSPRRTGLHVRRERGPQRRRGRRDAVPETRSGYGSSVKRPPSRADDVEVSPAERQDRSGPVVGCEHDERRVGHADHAVPVPGDDVSTPPGHRGAPPARRGRLRARVPGR